LTHGASRWDDRFVHFFKDRAMNQTSRTVTLERPSPVIIRPLDPVMGAEVTGVDVSRPLSREAKHRLEDAFNEYKLLCFRQQVLTTDSLVAFTRNWGEPGEHTMPGQLREGVTDVNIASNADAEGKPNGKHPDPTAMRWHTDRSWRPDPVTATLLYGVEVPGEGGDTLFCNTAKAYEALPQDMKRRIDSMRVIHSVEFSRLTGGGPKATEYELKIAPPQAHPLARTHPVTGKRAIYTGCHAWKIEGLPDDEGRELLDYLTNFATQSQFVYRHKWRKHDLLMWDNRCTFHAATPYDTSKELRTMYRTVVAGCPPV
jgi:alpha-ketoglutarate-dependent taurine dioxygenase